MKALVTGGAGFIGSYVVDQLVHRGIETCVLVSGFRSARHASIVNREAHVIKGDLRNEADLREATRGVNYVFHLGAVLSHYCDWDPDLTVDVNIKGTWNLKKACVHNKVERIIFASSSYVYGEPQTLLYEAHPAKPKELFGITKLAGEKILQATHPRIIPYTILRLFNVYGPRQYPDKLYTSVVSTWMMRALQKLPLIIHGDGTQELDFVYVKDVANAFFDVFWDKTAENEVFNVGSGNAVSMNELARLINGLAGNSEDAYTYCPEHPAYFKFMQADISKIEKKTGWFVETNLEQGLVETMNFYEDLLEE